MLISVLERRSEIGLRRALGATKGHVRIQFLTEAMLLASLGGAAGVGLGAAATATYAHTHHWPTVIPPLAWAGGLASALLIGAIAGLLPAIRAARMSPHPSPVEHVNRTVCDPAAERASGLVARHLLVPAPSPLRRGVQWPRPTLPPCRWLGNSGATRRFANGQNRPLTTIHGDFAKGASDLRQRHFSSSSVSSSGRSLEAGAQVRILPGAPFLTSANAFHRSAARRSRHNAWDEDVAGGLSIQPRRLS